MILYSLRTDKDGYRITKFDDGEPQGSYIVSTIACDCPAGHRHTCRHRQMLPSMLAHGLCDTHWFFCFDTGGQIVDFNGTSKHLLDQLAAGALTPERLEDAVGTGELCIDEGCPQAGTKHECVSRTQEETEQDTLSPNPMVEAWGPIAPEEIGRPVRINMPVPAGQHCQVAQTKSWRRM